MPTRSRKFMALRPHSSHVLRPRLRPSAASVDPGPKPGERQTRAVIDGTCYPQSFLSGRAFAYFTATRSQLHTVGVWPANLSRQTPARKLRAQGFILSQFEFRPGLGAPHPDGSARLAIRERQKRTARAFARLTPTCAALTPSRAARVIHSKKSSVPAPRPWILGKRFRCKCAG